VNYGSVTVGAKKAETVILIALCVYGAATFLQEQLTGIILKFRSYTNGFPLSMSRRLAGCNDPLRSSEHISHESVTSVIAFL
jgi:hypothetical protein